MKVTTEKLTKMVITDAPSLDPIHVYAEDLGPSRGSLLVRCFDRAWYAYWGAMGTQKDGSPTTVRQFVLDSDPGYVSNCLVRGNRGAITSTNAQGMDDRYVERITVAVQHAMRDTDPRVTPARSAKLQRLQHANALIKVISDYGRGFFWNAKEKRVARFELDQRGKIWWIDDYQGTRVCTEQIMGHEHRWYGFSHGGTLKSLVQQMREYIKTGERISLGYIAMNCWGYEPDAAAATREAARTLPIIK